MIELNYALYAFRAAIMLLEQHFMLLLPPCALVLK
jgi:hypothetical protein